MRAGLPEFSNQKSRAALPVLNDEALDRGQLMLRRRLRRLLQLAAHQPRQLGKRALKLALRRRAVVEALLRPPALRRLARRPVSAGAAARLARKP